MNAGATNTTTAVYYSGISVPPGKSPEPEGAKGLIATRAVETKAGWVGQVITADEITWESDPYDNAADAERKATAHVVKTLKKLFR